MQARRILLLFAVVLLLTAAAASFVPVPEETATDGGGSPPAQADADGAPDQVVFAPGGPPTRRAAVESRVVVTVETREPGEVEIQELGRLHAVGPLTPAVFDLFPTRAGRFEVLFRPVEGTERRLGTLVVGEGGGDDDRRPRRSA